MTTLSSEAQAILDAFHRELPPNYEPGGLALAFRVFVNAVVPHEDEAPKAVFDCEPTLENKDGTFRYDHGAHLRRQFRQDTLNIRWEQRQQTRAMMLAIIEELK